MLTIARLKRGGKPSYQQFVPFKLHYSTIQRYVVREFFHSFLVSFLFFFFIFIINQLLLLAKELAQASISFIDIIKFLFYAIPVVVMLSIPFAALVGMLMAIAHLASTNQILAMRSCGISISALFVPQLIIGLLLSLFSLTLNDYFLPLGLIQEQKLRTTILQNNPRVIIKPYSIRGFTTSFGEETYLISGEVDREGIHDLLILDHSETGERRTFDAKLARVADYEMPGVIGLQMDYVTAVTAKMEQNGDYEYLHARSLRYNILLSDVSETILLSPNQKQARDIWREIVALEKRLLPAKKRFIDKRAREQLSVNSLYASLATTLGSNDRNRLAALALQLPRQPSRLKNRDLQSNKLELAQRFAVPLVTLPFIVLAFALGLTARKHGRTVGFLLGLFFCFVYWSMLISSKIAGANSLLPPYLTMFSGNIFFGILSMLLFLRLRHR